MKRNVQPGDNIVVWFSCGIASAMAAYFTIILYGDIANIRIVNNPIADEDDDNQRFLHDVEQWLGVTIESCVNPKYPKASIVEVFNDRKFMSSPNGAPCTYELKKRARQIWENDNPCDWLVLGFTSDEQHRAERFILSERDTLIPVLCDLEINRDMCFQMGQLFNLELPNVYKMGYPNANCIGCVKASSPTYWNHVRLMHPEIFEERAEQSARIGAKLVRVKGERILLKDLDPNAKGRPLKTTHIECGIFCEEK